jgi:hypothetical protein
VVLGPWSIPLVSADSLWHRLDIRKASLFSIRSLR